VVTRDPLNINLAGIGWDGMNWIDLAQEQWWAVANTVINLRVP
jgi:hypothetical protein